MGQLPDSGDMSMLSSGCSASRAAGLLACGVGGMIRVGGRGARFRRD